MKENKSVRKESKGCWKEASTLKRKSVGSWRDHVKWKVMSIHHYCFSCQSSWFLRFYLFRMFKSVFHGLINSSSRKKLRDMSEVWSLKSEVWRRKRKWKISDEGRVPSPSLNPAALPSMSAIITIFLSFILIWLSTSEFRDRPSPFASRLCCLSLFLVSFCLVPFFCLWHQGTSDVRHLAGYIRITEYQLINDLRFQ